MRYKSFLRQTRQLARQVKKNFNLLKFSPKFRLHKSGKRRSSFFRKIEVFPILKVMLVLAFLFPSLPFASVKEELAPAPEPTSQPITIFAKDGTVLFRGLLGSNTYKRAPHAVDYVLGLLEEEYPAEELSQGGLSVETTIDINLQNYVQQTLLETLLGGEQIVNSAVIVAGADGSIEALVGSSNYYSEKGAENLTLVPLKIKSGEYSIASSLFSLVEAFLSVANRGRFVPLHILSQKTPAKIDSATLESLYFVLKEETKDTLIRTYATYDEKGEVAFFVSDSRIVAVYSDGTNFVYSEKDASLGSFALDVLQKILARYKEVR